MSADGSAHPPGVVRRIAVTLWVELEDGADPDVVADGLFVLACAMPEGTDLDAAVACIDACEWKAAD